MRGGDYKIPFMDTLVAPYHDHDISPSTPPSEEPVIPFISLDSIANMSRPASPPQEFVGPYTSLDSIAGISRSKSPSISSPSAPPEGPVASSSPLRNFANVSRHNSPPIEERHIPDALPSTLSPSIMTQPIYETTGNWEWAKGRVIKYIKCRAIVAAEEQFTVFIKTGMIEDKKVNYMSKACHPYGQWNGFLSELALLKVQLRPLQGDVVPEIIGAYNDLGRVSIAMTPPHHSFWMEASSDMPDALKSRCVEAAGKLHAAGVCHGDLKLSNILIGGDAKVTIINFQKSRTSTPNASIGLLAASPADFRMEIRKLKWQLDFRNSRAEEDAKYTRFLERKEKNKAERGKAYHQPGYTPVIAMESEDDRENPAIGEDIRYFQWLAGRAEPRRFIMPGQTAENLALEIGRFMDLLQNFKEEQRRTTDHFDYSDPPPTLHHIISSRIKPAPESLPDRTGVSPSMTPRYHLRKRKTSSATDSSSCPAKKMRFAGMPEVTEMIITDGDNGPQHQSMYVLQGGPSTSRLPAVKVRDFAYEPKPFVSRQSIIDENLRHCIEFGLPHPDALELDPENPRWRDPDVLEYVRRHNRKVISTAKDMFEKPARAMSKPRARRCRGSLKRAMDKIADPPRFVAMKDPRPHGDQGHVLGKRKHEVDYEPMNAVKYLKLSDDQAHAPNTSRAGKNHHVVPRRKGILKNAKIASKNRLGLSKSRLLVDKMRRAPYPTPYSDKSDSSSEVGTSAATYAKSVPDDDLRSLDDSNSEFKFSFTMAPPSTGTVVRWMGVFLRMLFCS